MSILTKLKEIFFPTKITEQPFPNVSPATSVNSSETKDVYYPTEISPKEFAIPNIATGLRSTTLDTESRQIMNNFTFSTYGAMTIGEYATGNGIRISPNGIIGINGGVTKFTLSSDGNFVTTGFIQVGGAAADVNAGITLISAGKILISGSTVLSSWSAGADATYIDGGKLYTGTVTADTVRATWVYAGTLTASQVNAVDISASSIKAGTLSVGGSGQPNAIIIKADASHSDSNLRWEGGSRLWEDAGANLGIRAAGAVYLYAGSYSQEMVITSGSQVVVYHGLSVQGGGLNAKEDARMEKDFTINYDHFHMNATGGIVSCYITDGFNFHNDGGVSHLAFGNGKQLVMNADKTAIVPTSKGYRALYCMESPEVWFMDFCPGKKKYWWKFWDSEYELHPDPLFMEVTEKPYVVMPTMVRGLMQIWGKRKGHLQRFDEKTKEEYEKNNEFWSTPHKK